jgi:hypothetical protein
MFFVLCSCCACVTNTWAKSNYFLVLTGFNLNELCTPRRIMSVQRDGRESRQVSGTLPRTLAAFGLSSPQTNASSDARSTRLRNINVDRPRKLPKWLRAPPPPRPHRSHFKILLTPCQIGALFCILLQWYYRHWITDASQSYIHYLYHNMHRSIDADTYDFGNVFRFHLLGLITLYCFTTKFLKIYLCTNIVVLVNAVVIISTMSKIWLYQLVGSILIVVVGCPKAKRLHYACVPFYKMQKERITN